MKLAEWDLLSKGYTRSKYNEYYNEYSLYGIKYNIVIGLYSSGALRYRRYVMDGRISRHSDEGPAYETFFEHGKPCVINFCFNGHFSRPISEGPAYVLFDEEQRLVCQEYWLDGKFIK